MLQKHLSDNLVTALSVTLGGLLLYQILFFILKRWAITRRASVFVIIRRNLYGAGFFLMLVITLLIDLPYIERYFNPRFYVALRHGLVIVCIFALAFLVNKFMTAFREILITQYKRRTEVDFSMRKANTKFLLIQQVLTVLIYTAAGAIALMTFNGVRQLGSSLLASAGVVGLILGFAAQKSLGTLFAGIQIAISQPIRLDDVVVVEDRFGTIGEISLTYVIVNVWDGSRLVVPINYFLEKPFENWTRVSSDVIAKVKIKADFRLPIEELRSQFFIWLAANPLWDKRSAGFVVTDASERTLEIRATMSVRNSGDAFDLECQVREKLITYIRQNYPDCLPQVRYMAATEKNQAPGKG